MKKLWHLIEYALAKVVLIIIAHAPVRFTLAFAGACGWLIFHLLPSRARIAVDNILAARMAPDRAAARRLGRRCFQSFTRMISESVIARSRIRPDNWRDFVTLEASPEALALLHDPKQGAVVASGHLGNWEVAARASSMVHPLSVIYRPFNNPYLNHELNGERGGEQLHLISKYKASPMRFLKLLAAGEFLALMIDQHISEQNERVRVNFFGRPCWAPRAVAMMHLTTRVPILLAVAARTGPMTFRLHVTGPIQWQRTHDREVDIQGITQALTDEVEHFARRYPEQYLWGHRRWKE